MISTTSTSSSGLTRPSHVAACSSTRSLGKARAQSGHCTLMTVGWWCWVVRAWCLGLRLTPPPTVPLEERPGRGAPELLLMLSAAAAAPPSASPLSGSFT